MLVVMSLYSLAITGERLMTFWRGRKQSRLYIAALAPMVEGAGRLRDAVGLDKRFAGSPVANVIGAGLNEYARGIDRPGAAAPPFEVAEVVNRAMERSKERELAGLRRGMPVLATVASSAPFVGLFGTVGGIITAFQKLADPTKGGGGIGTVSAGIAEALITTAVGPGRRDHRGLVLQLLHRAPRRHHHRHRRDRVRAGRHDPARQPRLMDNWPLTPVRAPAAVDGGWRSSAAPRGRCAPRSTSPRWSTSCWCC